MQFTYVMLEGCVNNKLDQSSLKELCIAWNTQRVSEYNLISRENSLRGRALSPCYR